MARLEIDIVGNNAELKKVLADSKIALSNFQKEVSGGNRALDNQALALAKSKTATQQARQAIAELTLANRQNKGAVDGASGSYREAQQRLTAMGKSIRESANGFDLSNTKVRQAVNEYNALNNKLKEFDKTMGNNYRNVGDYGSAFAGAIPYIGQFAGAAGAANAAVMALEKSFTYNMKLDAFKTALREVSNDSNHFNDNLEFLRQTSDRLGLDFLSLGNSFKQWQGSAKFSNLTAEESRKIFDSVANAAAKMKLSTDDVNGTFRALYQMLSKGKVSAEELRQQLGERLPVAFSLAVKASGKTEAEFNKLLETGKILSGDFLPKFADELDKAFGNDKTERIESMQAEVVRLKNAWNDLFESENATSFFTVVATGFTKVLTGINNLVNSSSWKSLATMFINPSLGITSLAGNILKGNQKKSLSPVEQYVSGFTDLSNEQKKLQIQQQTATVTRLSKEYNEKKDKETLSRLTYHNASLAEMNRLYYSQLETKKNINNLDAGGSGSKSKGKTQADLIKEANDALKSGQNENLKGIDNELAKIDKKWDGILEKIKLINNEGLKKQLSDQVELDRALDKSLAKLDAWGKTKLDVNAITRSGTISPTLSGIPTSDALRNSNAGFLAGVSKGFEDKEAEQLQKEISRIVKGGVRRGFDDIISNIDNLGSNFYQVFTNVFGKLAGSIQNVFNDLLGNQLGNLLKDGFGDFQFKGLSKELSQGIIAGVGALGSVLGGLFKSTSEAGQGLSGALSGAAMGVAAGSVIPGIGTVAGGVIGGLIGAISGIFGAKERKKQLALQEEQLKEQRKQTLLQERANALAYSSSIIGQMSNRGIVQGVDVNEFGELVFRIEGRDLVATMTKEEQAQKRGL